MSLENIINKTKKSLKGLAYATVFGLALVGGVREVKAETYNVNPKENIQNVIEDPNVVKDYNIYISGEIVENNNVKLEPISKLHASVEETEEFNLSVIQEEYKEYVSDYIYTAWFYDDSNSLLRKYTFLAEPLEFPEGTIRNFMFHIEVPSKFSNLVIKHNEDIIHRFKITPNAPTVNIISPAGGEKWDATHTVKWTGLDPDRDDLLYTIYYKFNASEWRDIQPMQKVETKNTSLSLDTTHLPGGKNCLIKVIATDGFNEGEAVSNVFSVANKPPHYQSYNYSKTENKAYSYIDKFSRKIPKDFVKLDSLVCHNPRITIFNLNVLGSLTGGVRVQYVDANECDWVFARTIIMKGRLAMLCGGEKMPFDEVKEMEEKIPFDEALELGKEDDYVVYLKKGNQWKKSFSENLPDFMEGRGEEEQFIKFIENAQTIPKGQVQRYLNLAYRLRNTYFEKPKQEMKKGELNIIHKLK